MDVSHFSQLRISADSERRDRLSELPNSLNLKILSFLEMKDVVRTTILSKRWKDLWITVPCLDFGDANPRFVAGALKKWKGNKILKFSIAFWKDRAPSKSVVDSWLLLPIQKRVEDLFVYLGPHVHPDYCAPQRLYSCSSLTKLFISCCNLKIEKDVQWNHLKSLTIDGINNVSEDAMTKILSGAPLLEELVLNLYEICGNLNIRSTSLKVLHIGRHDRRGCTWDVGDAVLRIRAPNLLTLEISAFLSGSNCLFDVPCLTSAILHLHTRKNEGFFGESLITSGQFSPFEMFNHVFPSIRHVEKLMLSAWCSEFLVSLKKKDMAAPFSNATFLKLYTHKTEEMLDVLEMFPNLMMLTVDSYHDVELLALDSTYLGDECNSSVPKMTLSNPSLLHLKTVEITWSVSDASLIPAIKIMLENAHVLEKMVLQLRNCGANEKGFTLAKKKVLRMRRSSPTAQIIISKQR